MHNPATVQGCGITDSGLQRLTVLDVLFAFFFYSAKRLKKMCWIFKKISEGNGRIASDESQTWTPSESESLAMQRPACYTPVFQIPICNAVGLVYITHYHPPKDVVRAPVIVWFHMVKLGRSQVVALLQGR